MSVRDARGQSFEASRIPQRIVSLADNPEPFFRVFERADLVEGNTND